MRACRRSSASAVRATADRLIAFARRPRDPAPPIDALDLGGWPDEALAVAKIVWSRRVVNETHSVELARHLARAVASTPLASDALDRALARLEDDEQRHVELASTFLARLGAAPPAVAPAIAQGAGEPGSLFLLRCVLTGLAVCETVSAVRFAMVRRHTDLAIPRACIELFLRDEIAHARLGFLLLPDVVAEHAAREGRARADADVASELRATFRHLDLVVGLDADRRGIALVERPQPERNPGVVEPALDAIALRSAITRTVVPRLAALGIDAAPAWQQRWVEPGCPA